MPLKCVSRPGEGSEEFHSNGSERRARSAQGLLTVGGEVSGSQHRQPCSNLSGVYSVVGSTQLTSPTWWVFRYPENSSKVLSCISLEGESEP